LPDRTNLVLTRAAGWAVPGTTAVPDLDAALRVAAAAAELMVAGGAQVYALALPRASRVYLTRIHALIDGDTRLPELDLSSWQETSRELHPADARHAFAMSFITLERRSA
jgi:dihydrofolate reductase